MSEKRFVYDEKLDVILYYDGGNRFQLEVHNLKDVTVTLNTLYSRIELLEDNCLADNLTRKHLEGIINESKATITELERKLNKYAKIGEEQLKQIMELQDLCGQSDGENAKLRIENKRLEKEVNLLRPTNIEQYEQIQKLQEENEQLKNKLNKGL